MAKDELGSATEQEKPKDDNEESEATESRFKATAKKGLKAAGGAAKNKIRNSDTAAGAAMRTVDNVKNTVKKTKKYIGWAIKYFQFCISNPIGWMVGILTISMCWSLVSSISDALDKSKLSNTEGEKATVILMDCPPGKGSGSANGKTDSSGASDEDWTKEGTTAYKNAKYVFDTWVGAGLSGEAAAGIVGWVASEGGFDIVGRAEGHYGGGEKDSLKNGAVPIPSGPGYTVAGGGIYQFTPYTKYAELNDPKWEDPVAITKFAIDELAGGSWMPNPHDLTGGNHTLEQFAQETDPTQATLMFNAYERGNPAYIRKNQKQEAAKKANEVFNKDGHKFDRAKFEENFGKNRKGGSKSSKSSSESKGRCKPRSRGGNGWQGKGGKHNYNDGNAWKPTELPDDLKQYALDPESLGMKYGSSTGWDPIAPHGIMHNQCTGLSATLMHWLWEKDGKHPTQLMGNGNMVTKNWANTFGGSVSNEPVSGAVFSSDGRDPRWGHTGVVSHVFDDDSILIVEQNFQGLSGEANGTSFTWNYRIMTKKAWQNEHMNFYNPGDNGFTVNSKAKSM